MINIIIIIIIIIIHSFFLYYAHDSMQSKHNIQRHSTKNKILLIQYNKISYNQLKTRKNGSRGLKTELKTITNAGTATFHPRQSRYYYRYYYK